MTMGLTDRGSERVVDTVAAALAHKHDVTVYQAGKKQQKPYRVIRELAMDSAPDPAPRSIADKIRLRLGIDRETLSVIRFTKACVPELERQNPDIIIAINGSAQIRILKDYFPTIPLAAFGHAGMGLHDRRALSAKPTLFVALSPAAEKWALQYKKGDTRVVYIPNPVSSLTQVVPAQIKLPTPVILTVGALSAYKNIFSVMNALESLNMSWILVGDGEQHDEITRKLSSWPHDFRWIQHADPQDMQSIYASADVFCFVPDPQESFGMVLLEAMSAGLPIVTSDDSTRRGIVGEHGYYVDPHDSAAITAALIQAVQLDKVDYRHELAPYSVAAVVKQIEKELHALIA
jgi:glycosyltransferase involved in cell wall biosynthesis